MVPLAAPIAAWGTAWYSSFPENYCLREILAHFDLFLQAGSALFSLFTCVSHQLFHISKHRTNSWGKKGAVRVLLYIISTLMQLRSTFKNNKIYSNSHLCNETVKED